MPIYLDRSAAVASRVVFDLESLLVETLAGVCHSLDAVAQTRGGRFLRKLTIEDLRATRLRTLLVEIAGTDDEPLIDSLFRLYWRNYEDEGRYRAPLRPGARDLVAAIMEWGMELHYVTTLGPDTATKLVRELGLNRAITSIYTSPSPICGGARAGVFENFVSISAHPPGSFLLLSDHLPELMTAQRLGVPALGIGYGHTPHLVLDTLPGVLGVASSPTDVIDWLSAQALANEHVQAAAHRNAVRLH